MILQIMTKQSNFKAQSHDFQRQSISIYTDLAIMVEIVFHRMFLQKRPFQMLFGGQEKWDTKFKRISTEFQDYSHGIIRNFASLTQLLLYKGGQGQPEHMKALQGQEGCELTSKLAKFPQ